MRISRLKVERLRSLVSVNAELDPRFNFFVGPNGSGKTSVLEAVYLLGHGRSFRTRYAREVVQRGADGLSVFGRLVPGSTDARASGHSLGVEVLRAGTQRVRLDGVAARSASDLARLLPMMVVNADAQRLLGDGARERRAVMDWLLFHVEQDYHEALRDYRRALLQRNAALRRSQGAELRTWTEALAYKGERLNSLRASRLPTLLGAVSDRVGGLLDVGVAVGFRRGWREGTGLLDVLREGAEGDAQQGSTRAGPHRADLVLRVDGRPAHRMLSRGEGKLLVYALAVAQVTEVQRARGVTPLLLLDDLPAELDKGNRRRFLAHLASVDGVQVLVTSVGDVDVGEELPGFASRSLFHVEQGRVLPMV